IALVFTIFIVFLGLSAAVFGRWLERVGPRKAGVAAAFCWGGGYLISAIGVYTHQLWLLYLGNGVSGGCALGLGYISPVSTSSSGSRIGAAWQPAWRSWDSEAV